MHEFLRSVPYDLFEIHLVHLVARQESFTKAGNAAGLSQSAITRQIQGIESRLGIALFERTTRRVKPTPAGEFFLRETAHIPGDVEASIRRLREEFSKGPKVVRTGISRTISLAYLPGFFFSHRRHIADVPVTVFHESGEKLLQKLQRNEIDVAILCPSRDATGDWCEVAHHFRDEFVFIAPAESDVPSRRSTTRWPKWACLQNWLLISSESETGLRMRRWIGRQGWKIDPIMELDNFDSVIQLVALGMGVSLVPHRALAIHARNRRITRHPTPVRFSRDLKVLTRRNPSPHVREFVSHILF